MAPAPALCGRVLSRHLVDLERAPGDLHLPDHGQDLFAGLVILFVVLYFAQISADAHFGKGQSIFFVNSTRARGHDQEAFAKQEGFFNRVCNQNDRLAGLFPKVQHK